MLNNAYRRSGRKYSGGEADAKSKKRNRANEGAEESASKGTEKRSEDFEAKPTRNPKSEIVRTRELKRALQRERRSGQRISRRSRREIQKAKSCMRLFSIRNGRRASYEG